MPIPTPSTIAALPSAPHPAGGWRRRLRLTNHIPIVSTMVAGFLGACGKGVSESTIAFARMDEVRELQAADVAEPRTLLLIDPRPTRRYAEAHLPGAVNIQLPEAPAFGGRDPRIMGHTHVIVYGENPASPTARAMTKRLLAIGYTGVRLYPGGVEEWQLADLPLETSPMPEGEEPPPTVPN